jgi:N6-L-threonylcarbamoyladenine synthase
MVVLAIETSCDETSAAVLDGSRVLSNVISSQLMHSRFGGVVPEIASRAHQKLIVDVIRQALTDAGVGLGDVRGVAATRGPGLVGALLVGLNVGKSLAYGLGVPFVGVNHMEGHLYSTFLAEPAPEYPFVSLVVSGGHTMLVHVAAPLRHRMLGQTRDDAAGEAFDKVARMLGLGYPGGPAIDRRARLGNPEAVELPRAFLPDQPFAFSFSGVKTAVLYHLRTLGVEPGAEPTLPDTVVNDLCASFQRAVVDVLLTKTFRAVEENDVRHVSIAGGVAANAELRARAAAECGRRGLVLSTPSLQYCMDNAAMIGYAGMLRLQAGALSPLDVPADPSLSLSADESVLAMPRDGAVA